jgi:hypothetical protein
MVVDRGWMMVIKAIVVVVVAIAVPPWRYIPP